VKLGKHVEQIPLKAQVWQLFTEHVTHWPLLLTLNPVAQLAQTPEAEQLRH
jgi:hypothetical protein